MFESLEILKWVLWLVATVGVAGTIALFVFAPAMGRGLVALAIEMLHQLLATRFGCAVLAAVVVGLGVNHMRAAVDQDHFEQRIAQFEELQKERDVKIAAETRAAVEKEQAELTRSAALTDIAVKDFTNGLPIAPPLPAANPLRVGDDACKLRNIAGLPPCGSERNQRVSGARKRAAAAIHRARQRLSPPDGGIAGPAP